MRRSRADYALLAALLCVLGLLLVVPVWLTVRGAFHVDGQWTMREVSALLEDPLVLQGLRNSLAIAVCTTTLATLISLPVALAGARYSFPGKSLLSAALLAPLILPPFVGAIGVQALLAREGSVNAILQRLGITDGPVDLLSNGGFLAIVGVQSLALFPVIYLNVVAALANIDPALDEAARNAGAGAWTRFRRITLPLLRPGLFAGATIVFVWSFTELGTPLVFEFRRVTSVQIFDGLKEVESSARPYALTVMMLFVSAGVYTVSRALLGRSRDVASTKASVRRAETQLGFGGTLAMWALFGGLIAVACLPHTGVILSSLSVVGSWYGSILPQAFTLEHFAHALKHPLAAGSIRNSLMLSSAAVAVGIVIGLMAARLLVRSSVRGKWLLDALVMMPLAVPGLVMAFGYVSMSLAWPFAGSPPSWLLWTRHLMSDGTWTWFADGPLGPYASVVAAEPSPFPFLIAAYAVRRLPYIVRSASAGLQQTPVDLEQAAANAGAGRARILRKIVLPLVAANLVAGGLLAFSFSMLEVSDSIVLAQREGNYPVTKAIYTLAERLGDGPQIASAMGVWAMALLAATLLAASAALGKRLGAVFRG
jgi:iron(III) transport system permease protein